MENLKNNYLAVKSNTLIRQRTNLSLSQMKIVLFLIQAITKEDNEKGKFKKKYSVYLFQGMQHMILLGKQAC